MVGSRKYSLEDLQYLMKRLRDPETGCPWDLLQTYETIVPYTLEEVYEVVDTIERNDYSHLNEELGDLLFQVIFYAQLGEEDQSFDFDSIVDSIVSKLVARHPHVFPDGTLESMRGVDKSPPQKQIKDSWEQRKKLERQQKGHYGLLADIPQALPSLTRAQKIQKRASKVGFDWDSPQAVLAKIYEELEELKVEIEKCNKSSIAEEMGDILFTCVNLARHLDLDAESTLRQATRKFEKRFSFMEKKAEENEKTFENISLDKKEALWQQAKNSR